MNRIRKFYFICDDVSPFSASQSFSIPHTLPARCTAQTCLTIYTFHIILSITTPVRRKIRTRHLTRIILLYISSQIILLAFSSAQAEAVLNMPADLVTIDDMAFYGDTSIEKVILHEGVAEIGSYAFGYSSVREIVLPASVTYIAEDAFVGCGQVIFSAPDGSYAHTWAVEHGYSVQEGDFLYRLAGYDDYGSVGAWICGYTGDSDVVTVPATLGSYPVVVIDFSAFNRMGNITEVILPDGLRQIRDYAFYICSSLTKVNLPDTLTYIGSGAFGHCSLTEITLPPQLQAIMDDAFISNDLTSVVVPDNVTEIMTCAFADNLNLGSVTLPASLLSIADNAFNWCPQLINCVYGGTEAGWQSIHIGEGNYELQSSRIVFTDGVQESTRFLWNITGGVLTITGSGESEDYYWVGDSGTSAPWDSQREEITKIIVGEGITGLHGVAFGFCINVTEIVLPGTLTTIGNTVFDGCFSLTEITVPDGVTSIGDCAFYDCLSLTTIHLPDTLTAIGNMAFWNCPLTDIHFAGSQSQWQLITGLESASILQGATVHYGVADSFYGDFCYTIQDGECIITAYIGTDTVITIPAEIAGYPVKEVNISRVLSDGTENTALTKVTAVHLPATVERLGEGAFRNWTALKTVTGLGSVQTVGAYCFSGSGVTSLEFSAALSFAGLYAFDANDLVTLTIPDTLTWPGLGMSWMVESETIFWNHQALATINLIVTGNTPTLTKHGPALYTADMHTLVCYPCKNPLDSYVMPEGVVSCYARAFDVRSIYDASGLYELHVPASMTGLNPGSFYQGLFVTATDGTVENVLLPRLVVIENSDSHNFCLIDDEYVLYWRLPNGGTLAGKIADVLAVTITSSMSDLDKALALNEYLLENVEYDETLTLCGAGDALIGGCATCQGYTLAYAELLNACGIQNGIIQVDSLEHCFNSVYLNGEWVYVDVTWNDTAEEAIYFAMSAETVMEIYGIDPRDVQYHARSIAD